MINGWNSMNCGWLSPVQCGLFVSFLDSWLLKNYFWLCFICTWLSQFSFSFFSFPRKLHDHMYSVQIMISDISGIGIPGLQKPSQFCDIYRCHFDFWAWAFPSPATCERFFPGNRSRGRIGIRRILSEYTFPIGYFGLPFIGVYSLVKRSIALLSHFIT